METQELIAKYKRQLENKYLDDETKDELRKKIKALQGKAEQESAKATPSKDTKEKEATSSNSERIAELKELLKAPLPEPALKAFRKELEELEEKQKPARKVGTKPKPKPKPKSAIKPKVEEKPKPKPSPKPKVEEKPKPKKPKVTRKVVKDKPVKPKVSKPKVAPKPIAKEKPKVAPKPIAKKKIKVAPKPIAKGKPKVNPKPIVKKKPKVAPKKVYEPKVKTLAGEPDCDTLLKQFRARRRKSKEAQKKRKTTPIFRKISVDVVDAVEKAIKNVPAQQIKESPKETIRKFGVLKKLAQDFLNAFKDVLGKEFNKSEAKKELDELTILIDKLNKKYTSKK